MKVLGSNGSGSLSNVLEGLDFVHYDAATGDVANMSLGALASSALDKAVKDVAIKAFCLLLLPAMICCRPNCTRLPG